MTVATKEPRKQERQEMAPEEKKEAQAAEATRPGRTFIPLVDILESEDALVIVADMPGVEADSLTIDLRQNVLTIEGVVTPEKEEGQLVYQEYETGSFHRQFRLSNTVDQEKIDAVMKDGVLRLTLPKVKEALPRKIDVRTA